MEKKELNMKQFTATKTVKATPMTHGHPKKYSKELTDFQSLSPTVCKSKRQNFATALRLSTRSL